MESTQDTRLEKAGRKLKKSDSRKNYSEAAFIIASVAYSRILSIMPVRTVSTAWTEVGFEVETLQFRLRIQRQNFFRHLVLIQTQDGEK
jgi:hypothetical protein